MEGQEWIAVVIIGCYGLRLLNKGKIENYLYLTVTNRDICSLTRVPIISINHNALTPCDI